LLSSNWRKGNQNQRAERQKGFDPHRQPN
jgi:hypothetical protein